MSDAFVICSTKNSKSVEAELIQKGLKARLLKDTEQAIAIFKSNGAYFESGGTIKDSKVVLTSQSNYNERITVVSKSIA